MALSEKLQYLITVNADGAVRSFQNVGKAADKELGKAESRMDALGAKFTKFGVGALATAGVAAAGLWKLGEGASDLAETVSKSNVVFGDAAATIDEFGTSAAKAIGQSKVAAMDAAATFGTFGKSAGKTGQDLAKFSIDMVKLSSDMASFSNTTPEEAVMAIGAALRGESEPIRKYGVLLNDATLKNRAMELGIFDGVGALNAQQKVLAAQAEILAQTGDAQGDFARTSDGLANQQRIFAAELQNTKDTIGAAVLPAMQTLVGVAGDVFGAFNALPAGVQSAVGGIAGFGVAALGVVGVTSTVIGQLVKMRDTFSTLDAATGARSLTTLGKGIAGVGAVVGIAAIAYAGYNAKKGAAEARTKTFTEALLAEKKGQEGATAALIANNIASESAFDISSKLGISQSQLAAAIQGKSVSALDDLRESFDAAFAGGMSWDQASRTLQKQYGVSAQAISVFLQRLDEQSGAMATARTDAQKQVDAERAVTAEQKYGTDITDRKANATYEAAAATRELTGATEDGTDTEEEANKARQETAKRFREATQRAEEYRSKIEEMIGEERDAIQRQRDFAESLKDLGTALDDTSLSLDDQMDAAIGTSEAYATLNGESLNTEAGTRRQIESLYNLAVSLDPNSPLRKALLGYIEELQAIPAEVNTRLKLNISSGATTTSAGDVIGRRYIPGQSNIVGATGGIVTRPTLATIGEAGPEAVIPLDRAPGASPLPTGMGASSTGITVNIYPKALPTDRELIDLINNVRRRNGDII